MASSLLHAGRQEKKLKKNKTVANYTHKVPFTPGMKATDFRKSLAAMESVSPEDICILFFDKDDAIQSLASLEHIRVTSKSKIGAFICKGICKNSTKKN